MKSKLMALSLLLGFVLISGTAIAQSTIYQLDDYSPGPPLDWYAGENEASIYITTYENGNGLYTHTWTAPVYGTIVNETIQVSGNLTRAWIEVIFDNFPSGSYGLLDNIAVSVSGAGCNDNKSHRVVVIGANHPIHPVWW